tara:strand:+ start:1841 stop:2128 length:288 start_codon:yes stop_codon:yes gene_type:complete
MPPKKSPVVKKAAKAAKVPEGSHKMPDGSIMKNDAMPSGTAAKKRPSKAPIKESKPKAQGSWMAHVKKTWEAGKKKDPSFSYKAAMKAAKATYKK